PQSLAFSSISTRSPRRPSWVFISAEDMLRWAAPENSADRGRLPRGGRALSLGGAERLKPPTRDPRAACAPATAGLGNSDKSPARSEEIGHGGAILLHRRQVIAHGPAGDAFVGWSTVRAIDGDVRHPGLFPGLKFLAPLRRPALTRRDPHFKAHRVCIATLVRDVAAQLGELLIGHRTCGMAEHDPAVAPLGNRAQRDILVSSKPQRDAPRRRQRIDARIGDGVPLTLEGDVRVSPQRAQNLDLFLRALAAVLEVFVEGQVLNGVPAD